MQKSNWEKSRLHLHYTFNRKNSLGPVVENENLTDRYNIGLHWNHLLYRRNTRISQTNLYLTGHLGAAIEESEQELDIRTGLMGDWETRRYLVAYGFQGTQAGSIEDPAFHQKLRLGIAPYLAESGSIHTWAIVQVEHHPENDDYEKDIIVTPLLRFFKNEYLVEIGVNNEGDGLFNFIIRY